MSKTDTPSTDIVALDTPDAMVSALQGTYVPEVEDPEVIARSIMDRILAAPSADDVLGGGEAVHSQDVLGRPFTLQGLRLLRSAFDAGPGVFAVLDAAMLDSGEKLAITCSGRNVMAQAVRLAQLDALPVDVKIVQADRPTASGYYPLWLHKA